MSKNVKGSRTHADYDKTYVMVMDETSKYDGRTGYVDIETLSGGFDDGWYPIILEEDDFGNKLSDTLWIPSVSVKVINLKEKTLVFTKSYESGPDWGYDSFTEHVRGTTAEEHGPQEFIDKLFCGIPNGTKVRIKVEVVGDKK